VFWPLQSSSEFLGVPKDSKFPLLGVWVSSSHLAQSGVVTLFIKVQWLCCDLLWTFDKNWNMTREMDYNGTLIVLGFKHSCTLWERMQENKSQVLMFSYELPHYESRVPKRFNFLVQNVNQIGLFLKGRNDFKTYNFNKATIESQ
jgi:hypothetical protein